MREGLADFSERRDRRDVGADLCSPRVRKSTKGKKEGREERGKGDREDDRTFSHASVSRIFGAGTPAIPLSLKLVSSELRCLGIRLVKRLCCCCVGRIAGGNPRSLARRGRLSRLLQFKHNGGYLYRFKNKNDENGKGKREREKERKTGERGRARGRERVREEVNRNDSGCERGESE